MSCPNEIIPRIPPDIIFVIGPPCSGKSALCKRAAQEIPDVRHIIMSDLLREEEQELGSVHAPEIFAKLPSGTLVQGGLAVAVLKNRLEKMCGIFPSTILLDGFPRNVDQAQEFEKDLKLTAKAALSLTCSKEVAEERRTTRGRANDDTKTGEKRYAAHFEETVPAIEYLKEKKFNVVEVIYSGAVQLEVSLMLTKMKVSTEKWGMEGWGIFKAKLSEAMKV